MARSKGPIATTVSSKQLVASPGQEEEMQMQPLGPDKDLVLPNPLNISLLDVIKAFTKTEDMATAAIQRGNFGNRPVEYWEGVLYVHTHDAEHTVTRKVYVPEMAIPTVLHCFHDDVTACHPGYAKLLHEVQQ
eukprot:10816326-Prorocentrum_lima.AAC.1